jgi:hypothetical protein
MLMHQKHAALAADPGPREQRHPLLFRRQRHRPHRRFRQHPLDQLRMSGIRHVSHLADIEALQNLENVVRPGRLCFGRRVVTGVHV